MKILSCLLVGLFAICAHTQGQRIPEGADQIELTTTLGDSALFESVLSFLEDEGFDIDLADEDEGAITTEYKAINGSAMRLRISAVIENSIVLFKAQNPGQAPDENTKNEPVINRLSSNESFKSFDDIITKYAKTLDQATLEYHAPE
jgi:hypothetical protein